MAAVEIRVEVTAPDLSAAISELAHAIRGRQEVTISPDAINVPLVRDVPSNHPEPEAYQQLGAYVEKMKQQAAAQPEPVPASVPVPVAPVPVPASQPVPVAPVPAPAPQPVPVAPMPAPAPTTSVPPMPAPAPANITLTQIARAGAALVDQGKKAEVLGALRRYGVQAVTQLKHEQLGQFATELRALGAQI